MSDSNQMIYRVDQALICIFSQVLEPVAGKVLAVGRPVGWRMVLQASTEEGSMGGEEKVVQEAGHPGWDKSR